MALLLKHSSRANGLELHVKHAHYCCWWGAGKKTPKLTSREKYWGERNLKDYTCDGGGVSFPLCFITLNIFCLQTKSFVSSWSENILP